MSDEAAIQRTLNLYSEGASRGDWDQVLATYVPDGIWEVPALGARFEGREGLLAGLKGFADPMAYIVQLNGPALIAIDGDAATARSVIRECGKYADRDEALEILGHYADTLVRTSDGWKFTKRIFELQGMHTYPATSLRR